MHRPIERVFFGFALVLAAVCMCFALYGLRIPHGYQVLNFVMLSLGALLLVGAGSSVRRRWKVRPVLTGLIGVLSTVYLLSVLFLGWEDVGGAAVALPLVLTLATLSVLCFSVMFNR